MKHDTPGQSIKRGQSLHVDVDLALVPTVILEKSLVKSAPQSVYACFEANRETFSQLASSALYFPEDCDSTEILGLTVMNLVGKVVMECVIETKASMILVYGWAARRSAGHL